MKVWKFVLGAITDPGTKDLSSARVAGLACVIAGISYAFIRGVFMETADAATVAALVGGGAVPFLTRTKSSGGGEG